MKKFRLLLMMVLAGAVAFTACEPQGPKTPAPTVTVTLDEASVVADGFSVAVATTNAEKAMWVVVPQGDTTVTAETVLTTGTEIPAEALNVAEVPAVVAVSGLTAETAYDFYVAVVNKELQALSEVVSVTTGVAPAQVVEFTADETLGNGACEMSMSLAEMGMAPGHYLMLSNANWDCAMLLMLDYDYASYGCESYSYLTGHHYPLVAGSFNEMVLPTVSCLMVDPGYTNFGIGETTYYPIVPETEVDAEGNPYGVTVTTMVPQGTDLNLLEFNIPAVTELDAEGNPVGEVVIIKGSYMGSLQYVLSKPSYPFNLKQFGFTTFEATQNDSQLILTSQSVANGEFKMYLDLSHNNGVLADAEGVLYMAGDGMNLNGFYWSSIDDENYIFTEGGFILSTTAKANEFNLEVGERRGWKMEGQSIAYDVEPGVYTITINGLKSGGNNANEDVTKDEETSIIK